MPKIRALKPSFFTDESVVELSPLARLLYQGLWVHACDNGHVEDKPRQLKLRILPADNCDVAELLAEIEAQGMIVRANGWIAIPTLTDHQKPNKRYFLCCDYPGCRDDKPPLRTPREAPVDPDECPPDPQETNGEQGGPTLAALYLRTDGDGDGDGDGDSSAQMRGTNRRGTRLPDDWQPDATLIAWAAKFPSLNITAETEKFVNYWTAKTGRDATKLDWGKTWQNWVRNADERLPDWKRAKPAAGGWMNR